MKAAPVSCGALRAAQARGSGTEEADRGPGSGPEHVWEDGIKASDKHQAISVQKGKLTVLTITGPSRHHCN